MANKAPQSKAWGIQELCLHSCRPAPTLNLRFRKRNTSKSPQSKSHNYTDTSKSPQPKASQSKSCSSTGSRKYSAFTLLEALLVIGIFLMVFSLLAPFAISQLRADKVVEQVKQLQSLIYYQQQSAYSGKNDSAFGLKFLSEGVYTYQGDDYDTGTNRQYYPLKNGSEYSSVLLGGGDELHFEENSIYPTNPGTIVISDGTNSYEIIINSEGLAERNEI